MYKKIIFILNLLVISINGFSQSDSIQPAYLQFPEVPQFKILNAKDSSIFTRDNLKKKRPVIFIFFSPECDHCQRETVALTTEIKKFKNAQIVMVTWLPYNEMTAFYEKYNIANYPTITMGRDAKFYLPVFFKIGMLPAIYVYDKNRQFKKAFSGNVSMDKIVSVLE